MSDTPTTDAFEDLGFLDQQMTWIDFARQLERELAVANNKIARLHEAGNAVVARWDSPLWKDVEPTSHIIYALRDELAAQQGS